MGCRRRFGREWQSLTEDSGAAVPKAGRTRRLRDDPRCTVIVLGDDRRALTLETRVSIIDGPDSVEDSVRLFRTMQKRPEGVLLWYGDDLDEAAFKSGCWTSSE
jgi:hypothetical protein